MEEKRGKLKKHWIVLIVIAVLILALAIGGFAVVKSYLGQLGRVDKESVETVAPEDETFEVDVMPEPTPTPTPAQSDTPVVAPTPTPEPSDDPNVLDIDPNDVEWSFIERIEDDHLINILLVGQDKYPGETYTGRMHSDSMILCSIDPKTGETALISFLRDTYVQIPGGYSDNRLNAPYVFGGFDLLDKTLALNFGISVDANFEVDMASFEILIDMVGGVDIEVTAAEANYLINQWNVEAVEGMNHFDGHSARWYSQIRAIGNDFARTNRQRTVLLAALDKVKTLPVNDLLALMYDMLPYLTTDLTDGEILSLAYRLIPMISSVSVETHMVPDHDCYTAARIRGMSVLVPDREKIRARLEEEYLPLQP